MRHRFTLAVCALLTVVFGALGTFIAERSAAMPLAQGNTCNLYPIALSITSLNGVAPGTVIPDIYNGTQPGNFGWLTWAGSPSEPTLVTSLTPPGNSNTYVNPADPTDHVLLAGKLVSGKPGVSNSREVRDALNVLETMNITVPVWDTTAGSGSNAVYHVVAFAQVRITDYRLPGQNRISAQFLGFVNCAGGPIPD